jgi:hypothetical protein
MDDDTQRYWTYYREQRAAGVPPKQAVLKAHELVLFGSDAT